MRIAAGTSLNRLFIRTTSAASIATSVPAPIAIPISALVSAGASLIPSPTIATFPFSFSLRITCSFPSGSTPAITSLSPVSMTTWIPMFCNSLIACGLSSLMTSATAITPNKRSSFPKNNGVLPASASFSAFFCISPSTDTLLLINV